MSHLECPKSKIIKTQMLWLTSICLKIKLSEVTMNGHQKILIEKLETTNRYYDYIYEYTKSNRSLIGCRIINM